MWEAILANGIMAIVFWGGIALCVRFDQQGNTRRRELEHIERIRAIELGRPLDDTVVARYRALAAVGVAVPIASLTAAIGSCFALLLHEPEWRFGLLAVVWVVCGAVCLTSFSIPISVIALPARLPEA